jgi:hypothetical protein
MKIPQNMFVPINGPLPGKALYRILFYILLSTLLGGLTFWRFAEWVPTVFYGDDLAMFLSIHGSNSTNPPFIYLLSFIAMKFRPVFTGALSAQIFAFGQNINGYLIVNLLVNVISGLLAFRLFFLTSRSTVIAIFFSCILITSRFALYQTTQVTGQVESIAFSFLLLTLICASHAILVRGPSGELTSRKWMWFALISAGLAFHSHERYMVLVPWLLVAFLLTRMPDGKQHRIVFSAACLALLAANAIIKHFFLHAVFFEGTAGTKLTISIPNVINLASQAVRSVLGINSGPDYLIGIQWLHLPIAAKIVGLIFAVICTFFAIVAIVKTRRLTGDIVSWPILLVLLVGLLILPPSLTIRMEQRWELAPFLILLLLVAIGLDRAASRAVFKNMAIPAAAVIALASAFIDFNVSKSFDKIFLVSSERYAAAVKKFVIDRNPPPQGQDIALVTQESNCGWALMHGQEFFTFYEGAPRTARCINGLDDISALPSMPARVYVSALNGALVDVTEDAEQQLKSGQRSAPIDLKALFSEAKIRNLAETDTPTRTGTFVMDWGWLLGQKSTLVILSTHGLDFPVVPTMSNASLSMDVGMIYPEIAVSQVIVTISPTGTEVKPRVVVTDIPSLPNGEQPRTKHINIPLPELAISPATISIMVGTPSGNLNGQWAGFTSIKVSQSL